MRSLVTAVAVVIIAGSLRAEEPDAVRAAAARALPLLEKGAEGYTQHRQCFACHHQALPVLAMVTARAHGLKVNGDLLQQQVAFTHKSLAKDKEQYQKGRGQGGQVATAGYALLTLEAGGWKPDATTAAVAEYLLQRDQNVGYWKIVSSRPPSEATPFTSTYVALRGLKAYGTEAQQERIAARTRDALAWLRKTPAKDTEERVFRLWSLRLAGAADKDVQAARRELLDGQRPDGGWSQTADLTSDAYATGSTLVAMHEAGGLAGDDSAYRRGLQFLMKAQQKDGSWHVVSRSRPFQIYFESGFPYGKDQFISIAASGWATTALALALPPAPVAPARTPAPTPPSSRP